MSSSTSISTCDFDEDVFNPRLSSVHHHHGRSNSRPLDKTSTSSSVASSSSALPTKTESSLSSSLWWRKLRLCATLVPLSLILFVWIGYLVAEQQSPQDVEQRTKVVVVVAGIREIRNSTTSTPPLSTTAFNVTIPTSSSTTSLLQKMNDSSSVPTTTYSTLLCDPVVACQSTAPQQQSRHEQVLSFGGDLWNASDMLRLATKARNVMIKRLKKEYGSKYFKRMFQEKDPDTQEWQFRKFYDSVPVPVTGDQTTENGGSSSLDFVKKKLLIKVLSVQSAIRKQYPSTTTIQQQSPQGCDCALLDHAAKEASNYSTIPAPPLSFARFVWVTAGHSAAAGHGNFQNETSIAFLNQAVTQVFASIGIDFEGRNYAMGGFRSGGEVLMCNEAIFGTDVDMLTWDYGMTDGGSTELMLHYGYRAVVHPNRPALVAIGSLSSARMARLQELASRGLAVLYDANDDEQWALYEVPDSAGLTEEELQQLPPLVRNFKCDDSIEKGAPYCSSEKYNMLFCPKRKGRASWHPGWKWQALHGYSIALFLANLLLDVLSELVAATSSETFQPESRLATLLLEEEQLYSSFLQKSLPPSANPDNIAGVDFELLFKSKSFCHTALLPSRARYLGHVGTPQRNIGTGRVEQYDIGIPQFVANTIVPTLPGGGAAIPLAYAPEERDDCELPTKIDFKDFFYTHYNHGWTKIVLPNNDAEAQAYNYDPSAIQGLILVRLTQCPQNKCHPGDLKSILPADGVEVQVNGKPVTSVLGLLGMLLLQGDSGQYWTPNSQGRFEITVRVTVADHFLRISSLIIY